MSIVTIISHSKKDGKVATQLSETRRDFDTYEEAIAYIEALKSGPTKGDEA